MPELGKKSRADFPIDCEVIFLRCYAGIKEGTIGKVSAYCGSTPPQLYIKLPGIKSLQIIPMDVVERVEEGKE